MLEAGVDIVEIDRVEAIVEHHGDRFLHRIYTTGELGQCRAKAQSLAARFAAKEAAFKVLGMRMGWLDVEVCRHDSGKPTLLLHGRAAERAKGLGITQLALSLSHSRDYAVAVVVAQG